MPLGTFDLPSGADPKHIRIEVFDNSNGTNINIYLNGDLLISYLDTDTGRPQFGGICLRSYSGSADQTWDNFSADEYSAPLYGLADGLVAYYPFNNNADDESVNENDGVVDGASPAADRFSAENNAYLFDGINDKITVNNSSDFDFTSAGAFSISLFGHLDPEPSSSYSYLISKWGTSGAVDDEWNIEQTSDNKIRFYVNSTNSVIDRNNQITTENPAPTDEWAHIVCVYNNNASYFSIYINSELQISTDLTYSGIAHCIEPIKIGGGVYGNDWASGKLDDIRIYNRTLTINEIEQLYEENGWPITQNNAPVITAVSPESGKHNDPVMLTAASSDADSDPIISERYEYSFDNTNWHTLGEDNIPGDGFEWNSGLDIATVWIRAQAYDGTEWGEWFTGSGSFMIDNTPPQFSNWNTDPADLNGEHQGVFTVSLDITDNLSGIPQNTPQIAYKIGADSYSSYFDMIVVAGDNWSYQIPEPSGGWSSRSEETLYFTVQCADSSGNMQSEEKFDTIEATGISQSLIAYYPFSGDANDASGNGYHGTINGGVNLATDRFGNANNAYEFNGTDGYIDAGGSSALKPDTYSLCAWVYLADIASPNGQTRFLGNEGQFKGYCMVRCWDGTQYTFGMKMNSTMYACSMSPMYTEEWNFVVGTFDGSMSRIYINGTIEDSVSASLTDAFWPFIIGASADLGQYFPGKLDDVRLYDVALNSSEIQAIYYERGWNNLTGEVTSVNGSVEAATVELWDIYPDGSVLYQTKTDQNGLFYFNAVAEGSYDLRCYKTDYYPSVHEGVVCPGSSYSVVLDTIPATLSTSKACDFWGMTSVLHGQPLQLGDVVIAKDPDGVLCGKYQVTTEGSYSIHVNGDDPTTGADEGPVDGDNIRFYVNQLPAAVVSGSSVWQDLGSFNTELEAPSQGMTVNLYPNWNLISFNVTPADNTVETVIGSLSGKITNIAGYNAGEGFKTWDIERPSYLNDLTQLSTGKGYWIRLVSEQMELWDINGQRCQPDMPLTLLTNWNLIGYLPDAEDELGHALASLNDAYVLISGFEPGSGGGFRTWDRIRPSYLNDLQTLKTGYGYWIKMNSAQTLIYPLTVSQSTNILAKGMSSSDGSAQQSSLPVVHTRYFCDVWTSEQSLLSKNDRVTIRGEDGAVYGQGEVVDKGSFLIHVAGDDPATAEKEGAQESEKLSVYVNDKKCTPAQPVYWADKNSINIHILDIESESTKPKAFTLIQNYPNPFNPETTIHFEAPQQVMVKISIFNLKGEMVKTLLAGEVQPGTHRITWYGDDKTGNKVGSGIYVIVLISGETRITRKITLLR